MRKLPWSKLLMAASMVAATCFCSGAGGESTRGADAKGPSVLLLNEGQFRLDFNYLKALSARGFQIDYCEPAVWAKEAADGKLIERLRRYNDVVMIQGCGSNSFMDKEGMAKLFKHLAGFADGGGGLFMMPNPVTWDVDWTYSEFAKLSMETFGAAYPLGQWIVDSNPDNNATGGLTLTEYIWTDNVVKHDVTKGVDGVWCNVVTYRNDRCTTLPLDIGDEKAWTVVLKGSKTAKSVSFEDYCKIKKITHRESLAKAPLSAKFFESEPPLMAVRNFGKGRIAYLPMDDNMIWCNGYRHVHGGGVNDDSPNIALGGTLKGRKSCLESLIDNTLRWLAEPALAAGTPGGYVQDETRLGVFRPAPQPPLDWETLKFQSELPPETALAGKNLAELKKIASYHGMEDAWQFWKDLLQWGAKPFTGLIGARSSLSDGKSSVDEMAAAAKKAGLGFIVFLERFDMMTPEKLDTLSKECAKLCSDDFLALPGYAIDDNRNHSLFVFGPKLEWPAKWLAEDGKRFNMAATESGSGLTAMIDFMISKIQGVNDMGYYNFTAKAPEGQVRGPMYDLRLYSSVGLYHYDSGKLVEGPEQNWEAFKDVNDLALCIKPYAIDFVRSADELAQAAAEHALTRVIANDVKDIQNVLAYGFRGRESSVSVSPMKAPEIRRWTCQNRDYSCMPLRQWVTPNYRWRVECSVTSEDGLDTIEIWDGVDLFCRIKLDGAKNFHHIFELSHKQMQQLMLAAKDVNGRTAYSGAVQDGNHTAQSYFCSDRINGCLFHGPYGDPRMGWGRQEGRKFMADGYDGFLGLEATLEFHHYMPELDLGIKETACKGFGGAHPFQPLWSEDASIVATTSDYSYPPSEKIIHAWYTYGPLVERGCTGTVGWRFEGCGGMTKRESFVTMKQDGKINYFPSTFIDYRKMGIIPGNGAVFACSEGPKAPVYSFNIPGQQAELDKFIESDFRIGRGGFAACHGTMQGSGACAIFITDDYKRKLIKGNGVSFVGIETIPSNTRYKKGDRLTASTLQVGGYRPDCSGGAGGGRAPDMNGGWWYQRVADWLGLDGTPDIKLVVKAGTRMPPVEGFCDIDIGKDGYADMTFSPDLSAPLPQLGVRLKNANDRWSMMRYQPKLTYVDSVATWHLRYSIQFKREVEDGLKPLGGNGGIGYVTVDLPRPGDDPLQILAGHPVTCSDRRVFINVTALTWKPYTYAVTVNNPTDEQLKVTLKPGLPLPDFNFPRQELDLKPGELKVIKVPGK